MASNAPRATKSERLEAARIEARAKREAAEKKRRQRSLWTKIGIIVGIVALVAGGGLWYYFGAVKPNNTFADSGPIPAVGNQYGGVVLDSPTTMVSTGGGEVTKEQVDAAKVLTDPNYKREAGEAAPAGVDKSAKPAQIIVYVDPLCPHCAEFENAYAGQFESWLSEKKATVEYRMVSVIPSATNYPARAGNALYCVADKNPAAFLPMMKALFADQKERSNAELAQLASQAGAADLDSCISNGTFRPYGVVGQGQMIKDKIGGTPSIFVNGTYYNGETDGDFVEWANAKIDAANK